LRYNKKGKKEVVERKGCESSLLHTEQPMGMSKV